MNQNPNAPALDILLGGRYRLLNLIGTGGMAAVYRARDETLGRDVAIKLFRVASTNPSDFRRQQGEVAMLASLSHPGLVTLFDTGNDESDPHNPRSYLVMELISGSDLRNALDSGPLPSDDVKHIGADLADALHYIHGRNVIHRDVKPANVLLAHTQGTDTRAHPKLSDFGIARLVDGARLTATHFTVGSAGYLSPEQARGDYVGPATDVYSLGLVLLECVTGERVFGGVGQEAALAPITRDPQIPDDLDPVLAETIAAMTSRVPDSRPNAHEVALALRGIQPVHGFRSSADAESDATAAMTAAMTAPMAMPAMHAPEATKILPVAADSAAPSDTADTSALTAVLEQGPPPLPSAADDVSRTSGAGAENSARTRRRALITVAALAAVLLALTLAFTVFTPAADPGPAVEYPAVPGTIGDHLEELQESVTP
ncbi:tRNA A-37 threonylcarbamoyl transferase component Bud32 [Mycetocola sp. CAN_C7]|uniref:serine/threonine-protein kinase n=1 Tax=Mycetocola sp. CAN_C7 TaxID=2787724 RepID=UPI0018CAD780